MNRRNKESGHSGIAVIPNDRKKGKPTKKKSTPEKTQRILYSVINSKQIPAEENCAVDFVGIANPNIL